MGREVRKVPANWQHPRYTAQNAPRPQMEGRYIPLYGRSWIDATRNWDEENAKWEAGERPEYWEDDGSPETQFYDQWDGQRPFSGDYMPDWPEAERTHYMMYEDTSEGTPISPAFATPEELARWLADNGASSFGSSTATYEQWLSVCRGGWAPSLVLDATGLHSGVEFMAQDSPTQNA